MSTHPEDQLPGRSSGNGTPSPGGPARAEARNVDELPCLDFVAFLDDYLEGGLAPARRKAFETHLSTCPDCPNYLDAYHKTIELGRSAVLASDELTEVELPSELIRTILSTVASKSTSPAGGEA